jgi:hypothetical protein
VTTSLAAARPPGLPGPQGGRPCKTCLHPKRAEIDKALLTETPAQVSARFGVAQRSVERHSYNHLPAASVESSAAVLHDEARLWREELQGLLDRAKGLAESAADARDVAAAINAASKLIVTKGQHLKLIGDGAVNVWLAAGYSDEREAQADREAREAVKNMSPHEIHAQFMEFERRYALEEPGARRDYQTLIELSGGNRGQVEAHRFEGSAEVWQGAAPESAHR